MTPPPLRDTPLHMALTMVSESIEEMAAQKGITTETSNGNVEDEELSRLHEVLNLWAMERREKGPGRSGESNQAGTNATPSSAPVLQVTTAPNAYQLTSNAEDPMMINVVFQEMLDWKCLLPLHTVLGISQDVHKKMND